MPFCPNCGQQVDETMRFCPFCGATLSAAGTAVTGQPVLTGTVTNPNYTQSASGQGTDYRLVLVSRGSCPAATARELFQDVLGYSAPEAKTLVNQAPIEIARALSFQQALDLARMFTEYGMQIAVHDSRGYVDISQYANSSVFSSAGTVIPAVAATIASLTIANRVREFLRWSRPNPLQFLFAPRYRYSPPPRYTRPAPPPPPRPAPPSRPGGLFGGIGNRGSGRGPGGFGGFGGGPGGPGGPGGRGPGGRRGGPGGR